jgi:hypothetical protein
VRSTWPAPIPSSGGGLRTRIVRDLDGTYIHGFCVFCWGGDPEAIVRPDQVGDSG